MAYQFARMELFSRKGRSGRTTEFVFDEVSRRPDSSLHVPVPSVPAVVFGVSVEALRASHDERAASGRVMIGGKPRAIRKDQNTLVGVVLSHPSSMDDYRSNDLVRADVDDWERRSLEWLKEKYGDQLVTVVRHTDESHPHLHAYLLPSDPEMKATGLHPGFTAKNAIRAAGPTVGEDEKLMNKRANRAYVAGMRAWLDDYHERVAVPSGLTRLGPGKRRLTRAAWHEEQRQAQALKRTVERAQIVQAQGRRFIQAAKTAALAETSAAAEVAKVAQRAVDLARRERKRAESVSVEAARVRQEAETVLHSAERLKGLGGAIRSIFDGLRISKIRDAVAAQFLTRLDQTGRLLDVARGEINTEKERRRQAEKKAEVSATVIRELAVQRNDAWREIQAMQVALARSSPELTTQEREYKPR